MKTYNLRFTVDSDDERIEIEVKEMVEQYLKEKVCDVDSISFTEVKFISLNSKGSSGVLRKIRQLDIVYIEKSGHSAYVVTRSEIIRVNLSFSRLLQELDPNLFFRTHQGFIVNINEIKSVGSLGIHLFGCEKIIPVSRRNKIILKQNSYFS